MGVQTPPFLHFKTFSHRFAEQVLNSRLAIKEEILSVITDPSIDVAILSRPYFIKVLRDSFTKKGWQDRPSVFDEEGDPAAKIDFLKERVGIGVGFGNASFIGIDLLKFQVASYSGLDKIDVGVYIATTKNFQRIMLSQYKQNWDGSLTFEKIQRYLPHFKSAIQIPIYVIGIEL